MTTHIYLDVDGVINAVTGAERPAWGWSTDARRVTVDRWQITYCPALIERLNLVATLDHVQVHWLTTWNIRAAVLLAPAVGLRAGGTWPVLGQADQYSTTRGLHWWKLAAIQRHVAETLPDVAVWIDDDISFDQPATAWAAGVDNLLAISPRTELGITSSEMDLIDRAVAI